MISWIDIIIFLIVFRFAYTGFKRGGGGEVVLTVGSIVLCFLLYQFYGPIGRFFNSFLNIPSKYSSFVSYLLFIVGGFIILWLVAKAVSSILDIVFLRTANKLLGVILGAVKGAILCSIVMYSAVIFNFKFLLNVIPETSLTNKYIINLAPELYKIVKGFFK